MGAADVYGRKTEEDETEDGPADAEPAAPAEVRHACGVPQWSASGLCSQGAGEHINEKSNDSALMTHAGVR